jgi:hypothetical protein
LSCNGLRPATFRLLTGLLQVRGLLGEGDGLLRSGSASEVEGIGGAGRDKLSGDDLLIGSGTACAASNLALLAVAAE